MADYKGKYKGAEIDALLYKADTALQIEDVDSELSSESTNPVQNKVLTEALNQKFDKTGGQVDGSILVVPSSEQAIKFVGGEYIDKWLNIRLGEYSADWNVVKGTESLFQVSANGRVFVKYTIKASDYLDAYGISLYETFATKTELGDINAVLDVINGEVI